MPQTTEAEQKLGDTQVKILRAIQHLRSLSPDLKDRITLHDIGAEVGKAACTCHQHLSVLESFGYIERERNNKGLRVTKKGAKLLAANVSASQKQ